jgi:hypothetical protein
VEANEAQELKENAEHASSESGLRPVAFTMSVMAVLVAVMTVLGHRTHTEAVLDQNKATDQWNEYQAKKIRSEITKHADEILVLMPVTDKGAASKTLKDDADHQAKWKDELPEEQKKAEDLQDEVKHAEARADRFDLSEAMLEIGLVITSVTLLTRSRVYWYLGMVFSLCGIISALSVFTLK